MKKVIVTGIIILITLLGLNGCIRPTTGIMIDRLNKAPNTFINMTEEQINKFPLLKEAIQTNKTVEVSSPSEEISELMGLFRYFETKNIKYQN